jgi:PRTRC genetic system protein C
MEKKIISRIFKYKDLNLSDPGINLSIEEVKRHYSGIYPELTTAEIEGPKRIGGRNEFTFRISVGTKG